MVVNTPCSPSAMSDENLHKQKFRVEQWPTSKVTLYPTRASVVRVIENVKLKVGLNEITISDLTALADPDSIRVSGTTDDQPARINDLTVEQASNPYSTDDAFDTDSEDESESETDEEPEPLHALRAALTEIEHKISEVAERRASAEQELKLIQQYAHNLAGSHHSTDKIVDPETMKKTLELYSAQRALHYGTITLCVAEDSKLQKEYRKKNKALEKEKRVQEKALRAKNAERRKKLAEKQERRKDKDEQRPETSAQVLRVRITIEIPSYDTNAPSIVSGNTPNDKELPSVPDNLHEAQLTLMYTTSAASWTPMYDLRLDTLNPALSTLTYRAHFTNRTYETWTQASITLSTSQASFGGLNETIPQMESWRVTAGRKRTAAGAQNGENGLYSLAEVKLKEAAQAAARRPIMNTIIAPRDTGRHERFSSRAPAPRTTPFQPTVIVPSYSHDAAWASIPRSRSPSHHRIINIPAPPMQQPPIVIMDRAARSRSYSRSRSRSPRRRASPSPRRRASPSPPRRMDSRRRRSLNFEDSEAEDRFDETLAPAPQAMQHTLAAADTYGFTTTYELPTARTIPSSALVRRHVIAEIPLPSLAFTYIIVPKLKAAAFLKARVTNTSRVPLLPGQAGLTLDGSFMGNLVFPRCSPAETVVLGLGVDQTVKVEYERPSVVHAVQGMMLMGKEEVGAFKRTMQITNTKPSAVSLVVLDQVPVPDDQRLKVNITLPRGLKNVDDVAKNNVGSQGNGNAARPVVSAPIAAPPSSFNAEDTPDTSSGKHHRSFSIKRPQSVSSVPAVTPLAVSSSGGVKSSSSNWGSAKATLKKNGEVRWDVDLSKGGCVTLALEWECRIPTGEGVQSLS